MNKINAFFIVALASVAQLQAQTCQLSITETTPASEFTINSDGTVKHDKTGLTWMQCSLGQTWTVGSCSGSVTDKTWQAALQAAAAESFAGFDDWRLPNIKELATIAELSCISPAINSTVFPSTPLSFYWSGTLSAYDSSDAWLLSSNTGNSGFFSKSSSFSVRLVRGQ